MSRALCVTGAAGFLGQQVAAEALARGYQVTGVDRVRPPVCRFQFAQADIRDREAMRRVLRGHDDVVHLAAITSNVEFLKDPAEGYDVNVNGFLSVIDAATREGCERFAYASSSAVYLDGFSEDVVLDFRGQPNHYAKTKMMNEMVARSYGDVHGLTTLGFRYFNLYGRGENEKGDYASIISVFLRARRRGEPLVVYGDGSQARDFVHVGDAASLTLALLARGTRDVYNVGTGVATSYADIARMIDAAAVRHVPNPLPSYQHYTRADTGRLLRDLGEYRFVELAEGIAEMEARP